MSGTTTQWTRDPAGRRQAVRKVAVPAVLALAIQTTAAWAAPREAGIWYDDSGKGAVEIVPCGDRLCGRIMWLKEPLNDQGGPRVDRYNPNPAKRTTQICGLQVVGNLQKMQSGTWDSGWIYDPKTGQSYDLALQLVSPTQLKITGYKGVKLFSKSFTWTRAPDDLPRCTEQDASNKTAPKPAGVAAAPAPIKPPAPKPATRPAKPAEAVSGETLPWASQ